MKQPPDDSRDDDLALVRAAARGGRRAENALIRRMEISHRLLQMQNRRLGSPLDGAALEDVAQEAVMAMWARLDSYRGEAALEGWIYRFCFLTLMNAVRARSRQATLDLSRFAADLAQEVAPEPDFEIDGLLRHLGRREAEVVRLRHVEELAFEEVAQTLGISASSAKTHYYRGIEKLENLLEGREGT